MFGSSWWFWEMFDSFKWPNVAKISSHLVTLYTSDKTVEEKKIEKDKKSEREGWGEKGREWKIDEKIGH